MLCSAPIDAASAALFAAELKICPTIPTYRRQTWYAPQHRRPVHRVTIHDPVTNVPGAAPGTPPPPHHPSPHPSPSDPEASDP
eukprot:6733184-Prymnesium_polylepis.1